MFRKIFYILTFLVLIFPKISYPKTKDFKDFYRYPVFVSGKSIEYAKKDALKIAGDAKVVQKGIVIKAKSISYNPKKGILRASGNVRIEQGKNLISCDELTINMITRTGLIKNGFVFIEEQEGVISAKSIEKLGPSTFIVKDGTFTACTCKSGLCKSPAWKIKSKKMIVTIGEYAKAKGVTFYVKNVPVFYIPYFIYPVKRKRQTGFLAPQFQSGSGEGFGIKIPFFWAVSENMDATLTLDWRKKRGVGEGFQYRYLFPKDIKGKIDFFRFDEKESYRDWRFHKRRKSLAGSPSRWEIKFRHSQTFLDSNIRAYILQVSDIDFLRDFEKGEKRHLDYTRSTVFISKDWKRFGTSLDFRFFKDLTKSNKFTVKRLPYFRFFAPWQILSSKIPIYFDTHISAINLSKAKGESGGRFDIFPKFSYPFTIYGINLSPEADFRETIYYLNHSKKEYISRESARIGFRSFAIISKIFSSKYEHLIRPEVSFFYFSRTSQRDIPILCEDDRIFEGKILFFSLTNRVLGKGGKNILRFKVSGRYFFDKPRHRFSNLLAELELFRKNIYIDFDTSINPNHGRFESFDGWFKFRINRLRVDLQYRYLRKFPDIIKESRLFSKNRLKEIHSIFTLPFGKNILLSYENRASFTEGKSLENKFLCKLNRKCWGINFYYSRTRYKDEGRSDQRFGFSIDIFGVRK